jgi:hypothetical protein
MRSLREIQAACRSGCLGRRYFDIVVADTLCLPTPFTQSPGRDPALEDNQPDLAPRGTLPGSRAARPTTAGQGPTGVPVAALLVAAGGGPQYERARDGPSLRRAGRYWLVRRRLGPVHKQAVTQPANSAALLD